MPKIDSPRPPSPLTPAASPPRTDQKKDGSSSALSKLEPLRRPQPQPHAERDGKHVRNRHAQSPQAMSLNTIRQLLPMLDPKTPLPKALAGITALGAAAGKGSDPGEVGAVVDALLKDHASGSKDDAWLLSMLLKYIEALPTALSREAARAALQEALDKGPSFAGTHRAKHAQRTLGIVQDVQDTQDVHDMQDVRDEDVQDSSALPLSDQLASAQQQGANDDALISLIGEVSGEQRWQDLTAAMIESALEQADESTGTRLQQAMRCALQVSPGTGTLRSDLLATAYRLLAETFGPALKSTDAATSAQAAKVFQQGIAGCSEGANEAAKASSPRWASRDPGLKRNEFENVLSAIPAALRTELADRMFPRD